MKDGYGIAPASDCPKCKGLGFYYRTAWVNEFKEGQAYTCECKLR